MKKSWNELLEFQQMANYYATKGDTKLNYALKKVYNKINKHLQKYDDLLEEIKVDNCLTGDKGEILYDVTTVNGQEVKDYKRTPEQYKTLRKHVRDLKEKYDEMEFEFEPFFMTNSIEEIKELIDESHLPALEGFVIEPQALEIV